MLDSCQWLETVEATFTYIVLLSGMSAQFHNLEIYLEVSASLSQNKFVGMQSEDATTSHTIDIWSFLWIFLKEKQEKFHPNDHFLKKIRIIFKRFSIKTSLNVYNCIDMWRISSHVLSLEICSCIYVGKLLYSSTIFPSKNILPFQE